MRQVFDVANDVVARVANRPAFEWRQLGQVNCLERSQPPPQLVQWIGRSKMPRRVAFANGELRAVCQQLAEWLEGQKAIAPDFLAADNALEQAGVLAAVEEMKRRDRRQGVAEQPPVNRDELMHH